MKISRTHANSQYSAAILRIEEGLDGQLKAELKCALGVASIWSMASMASFLGTSLSCSHVNLMPVQCFPLIALIVVFCSIPGVVLTLFRGKLSSGMVKLMNVALVLGALSQGAMLYCFLAP